MATTLSFDDFDALRKLILDYCGIWLNESKLSFLQSRLTERLQTCHISTPREYYYFLKYDPRSNEEMQKLINAVTVNETWFFREMEPVEAWYKSVLPQVLKNKEKVSLWSAGCATGEEAYTLAMVLLDAYPEATERFDILATDISNHALEGARAASYDPYSLRRTEIYWQQRYFRQKEQRYVIHDAVRQKVRFGHANLVDTTLSQRVRNMDLILCRNVLIYLDERNRALALDTFYRALNPGGYLILGHSESLIHIKTPFVIARVDGKILYRRQAL